MSSCLLAPLTSATRHDLAAQSRPLKAPALEDHCAPVSVGSRSDVLEVFHVALEAEEELEGWEGEANGGALPLGVFEALDGDGGLDGAGDGRAFIGRGHGEAASEMVLSDN